MEYETKIYFWSGLDSYVKVRQVVKKIYSNACQIVNLIESHYELTSMVLSLFADELGKVRPLQPIVRTPLRTTIH